MTRRRKDELVENKKNIFFPHIVYRSFSRITRKLTAKDFVDADSFKARDDIMRIFAAECFELAQKFAEEKNEKLALQYTKLSAKMLGLSLRPKKLSDLDEIKRVLAELKAQEKIE
ncbi:MAG: hypothetical protein QM398_02845 [Thermoproteota archaeon]|nr:hypothetical protein [Thermoproteota archaeon]NLD66151.1 hypothetical protein [Thermoproteota archaeon]